MLKDDTWLINGSSPQERSENFHLAHEQLAHVGKVLIRDTVWVCKP
jgi:hypothetical protein